MNALPAAHVICIKWGTLYAARDVNRLYAMVRRNVRDFTLHFHCFTDDDGGLDSGIVTHKLPELKLENPADLKHGYRKEAGLCDDDLGGLRGERVLFLDLDVVITGALDAMIAYPQGDDVVIINDWNTPGNRVGQASCYSWRVGTLGWIKADFEARPREIIAQYRTACQEFLSDHLIARWGALHFWPDAWCRSFKIHCLPPWPLRFFMTPSLPKGTRVLAFHGDPKPDDALAGRWQPGPMPVHKRIYKTIRPAPWLDGYMNAES